MEQFEGQDILNFVKELPNDESCKAYLANNKMLNGWFKECRFPYTKKYLSVSGNVKNCLNLFGCRYFVKLYKAKHTTSSTIIQLASKISRS